MTGRDHHLLILRVACFSRGFARLATGMTDSLIQAAHDVEAIEHRHGLKIACIDEVADRIGFIEGDPFQRLAAAIPNDYGRLRQRGRMAEGWRLMFEG